MPQRTAMEGKYPPGTMRLLHEAFQAHRRAAQAYLAAAGYEGITLTHIRALQHVIYTGGSLSAIARRTGISRQAVAKAAAALEANGHLELAVPDRDRRTCEASLTRSGRRLFNKHRDGIEQDEQHLRELLGTDGLAMLRDMLRSMIDAEATEHLPTAGR